VTSTCDSMIIRQAAIQASLLVASQSFTRNDWADLQQDIIVDLLRRAPRFDPARGDWRGFVQALARNRASELIGRKRRRPHEVGFDDVSAHSHSRTCTTFDIHDYQQNERSQNLDVVVDVQRVLAGLPPHLRRLAELLGENSVAEVCARLGKSRSRVYQMTCELRDAFLRAGYRADRRAKRKAACELLAACGESSGRTKSAVRSAAEGTEAAILAPPRGS
jgi:RNA polymerase sigma-70 factor, ECF subfamily